METNLAVFRAFNQLGLTNTELLNHSLARPKFEISASTLLTLDFILLLASPTSASFCFFAF